eukprot:TRINITY_DN73322_c0_g1_i1.p1 TRINITY_DN73322_c0_g1~~TRINITY_DN73322_c0_g1_i1.p1  ORF type:complete len:503 (+),score=126.98 TRINITY_DN73322_c0_g1_i1:87-1595(+)
MRPLWLLSLLPWRGFGQECHIDGPCSVNAIDDEIIGPRTPRTSPSLADIIGLDSAKATLQQAVVLPLSVQGAEQTRRLFWRSGQQSAALLAGPVGLGKGAVVEAAAAAAGAGLITATAKEALQGDVCKMAAAAARQRSIVVLLEGLEFAPAAAFEIRRCLKKLSSGRGDPAPVAFVATMNRAVRGLTPAQRAAFGYVAEVGLPSESEHKQFLLQLLAQVSRVDPLWASALREAAVVTLAGLVANRTFAEVDFIVRRAFVQSSAGLTEAGGARNPVALHHFEQILSETEATALAAFEDVGAPVASEQNSAGEAGDEVPRKETGGNSTSKKKKPSRDPMDGIFGWCNFWLPEVMHLPPVIWAMIFFGILAHFMARSTYNPGQRRRRGAASGPGGPRSSLFGDLGSGSNPYSSFGEQNPLGEWYPGSSPFGNFPPPPGMPRPGAAGAGAAGDAAGLMAGAGAAGAAGLLGAAAAGRGAGAAASTSEAPSAATQKRSGSATAAAKS